MKKFIDSFCQEAKLHSKNKFFLWRAMILAFCVYVLLREIFDESYSSILFGLNLGIHEMGHFFFMPFGIEYLHAAGGTIAQLGVPIASLFMFYKQKDFFAIGFGLFWLATNFFYVAWYIGSVGDDVYHMIVPFGALGGGGEVKHDWVHLLGEIGLIDFYGEISMLVQLVSVVVMIAGIGWMGYMLKLIKQSPEKPTLLS